MGFKEWIMNEKIGIALCLALILVVGFLFFTGEGAQMGKGKADVKNPLEGVVLKLAFTGAGEPKLFAMTSNNALSVYETEFGNPIPENESMVIGAKEAAVMMDENLFTKQGDQIKGLFGIDTTIEGVLMETSGAIDFMHFIGNWQYTKLNGEENKAFIKFAGMEPKLFIKYDINALPKNLKFKEGTFEDYEEHKIVGQKFYPLILGSKEAEIMQEEKIFEKIGDSFEGFGTKFLVTGILEQTNTAFDYAHIVTLSAEELK